MNNHRLFDNDSDNWMINCIDVGVIDNMVLCIGTKDRDQST